MTLVRIKVIAACLLFLATTWGCRATREYYDSFGGSGAVKGEARGFFSLQQTGDRWWLVTPEGNGFLSLGVVHMKLNERSSLVRTKYAGDVGRFIADAATNVRNWGFNTAGYGSTYKDDILMSRHLPFMVSVEVLSISRWRPDAAYHYDDVFDPSWQKKAMDEIAGFCQPVKDNKNLIGYYTTDVPTWGLGSQRGETNWLKFFRSLPAEAPGKKKYIAFLTERHGSPEKVAERYGVSGTTSADLEKTVAWGSGESTDIKADDEAFLGVIAEEYYRMCAEAIRSNDPNHLYFGDRYADTDIPGPVLDAALKYVDAISVQTGFLKEARRRFDRSKFDELYQRAQKPIILCDFAVNFPTPEHTNVMWDAGAKTEEEAAHIYADFLTAVFDAPYMIGVHRCQYVDEARPTVLKQGLIQADGTPYKTTVELYPGIHRALYERMYRTVKR